MGGKRTRKRRGASGSLRALIWASILGLVLLAVALPGQEAFVRGDANLDGTLDVSDPIFVLLGLFGGGTSLPCHDAADANDDGRLDLTDAVRILGALFRSGPEPSAPFPRCGADPSPDALSCLDAGNVDPRLRPDYGDYFANHPTVAAASIERFDSVTRCQMASFLEDLEATGTLQIDRPASMTNLPDTVVTVSLTQAEAQRIVAAKAAHAIWLDKNELVSWRLEEYTETDLRGLFDEALLFNNRSFLSVVDYSPAEVFAYLVEKDLIRASRFETVHAVLEDLRSDFYHGSASYGDTQAAYTLSEALTTYSDRGFLLARIARSGCHSMARITVGVLRALNIPGENVTSGWFVPGHATAVWPAIERVLPHGDDIYSGDLRAIPDEELLTPFEFYGDPPNTAVCGADRVCLSRRYRALGALAYPAVWTTTHCCDPDRYGSTSCEDYLTQTYGAWLTPDEIAAAVLNVEAICAR